MSEETYLTPEGKEKLEKELHDLVQVKRPAMAQKLKDAIEDGDLKENANYHDAKEQQGLIESRVNEIERILRNAVLIDAQAKSDVVLIGSQVTIQEEGLEPETYKIVGSAEAAPTQGLISNESPIGAALLSHKVGDVVKVKLPHGDEAAFEIIEIG